MIRVKCGTQDISLYTHAWRPSKATSDSSKIYVSHLASPQQLVVSSSKVPPLASRWNRRLYTIAELMSKVDGFIRTVAFCLNMGEY